MPPQINLNGIPFSLGPAAQGAKNVLVPKGQRISLPEGAWDRVYVIAAAVGGDVTATISAGAPGAAATQRTFVAREWQ